ncbi:hypothetical protein IAU60_004700 [Kwoniella sp. DSM 27419]
MPPPAILVPSPPTHTAFVVTITHRTLTIIYVLFIRLPFVIMTAVIDAFTETLRLSQASSDPSSRPTSIQEELAADVSPQPTPKGDLSASDADRHRCSATPMDTPALARSLSLGTKRRVSISSARPMVATFRRQINGRVPYQADDEHMSEPSDSGGSDGGHLNHELREVHRPLARDLTIESNATSGSGGMASSFSTPAELHLGPQDTPFALRRAQARAEAELSPSKSANLTSTVSAQHVELTDYHTRSGDEGPLTSTPATRRTNASVVEIAIRLSSWREEQLKTARPGKLMTGTVPRPISTLHGPLTLPYARNPSGIDATVADETAHMSHVFGLRAAPGMTFATVKSRSVSSGTQSSGTSGSRSASGSSLYTRVNSSQTGSIYTEGSSFTSAGGAHHSRPLVVRDPHQNIGIKVRANLRSDQPQLTMEGAVKHQKQAEEQIEPISSDSPQAGKSNDNKENIDPAGQMKRRASDTSLLEPRLGEAVIGPSRSQEDLRAVHSLSPIPGSPANQNDTNASRTIARKSDAADTSASLQTSTAIVETGISAPELVDTLKDTSQSRPAVEDADDSSEDTPQIANPLSTLKHNKADMSANWRKRITHASFTPRTSAKDTAISKSTKTPLVTQTGNQSAAGVMTIDSLFEKFANTPPQEGGSASVPFKPPTISNPTKQVVLNPERSTPSSPKSPYVLPLRETSKVLNAAAVPYTPTPSRTIARLESDSAVQSPRSKASPKSGRRAGKMSGGTPGAGKLLRTATDGDGGQVFAARSK